MITETEVADLLAENQRLRGAQAGVLIAGARGADHTALYVSAVVGTSVTALAAIVTIFVVRPERDNTALIAIVIGFVVPIVMGFLAAAVREVQQAVNGRLTQLLALTAKASRAEGQLHEQAKTLPPAIIPGTDGKV